MQNEPLGNFIDAIALCLKTENWYAALTLTLTLPDICGSLETPTTGNNKRRYVDWCRNWLEPSFTHEIGPEKMPKVFLSADDFYQARNSILHSGNGEIDAKRRRELDRFEFFESGGHCNWIGGGTFSGVPTPSYLQLRVDAFCETVVAAVTEWIAQTSDNGDIQARKANLLQIHKPGKVIGGIRWG